MRHVPSNPRREEVLAALSMLASPRSAVRSGYVGSVRIVCKAGTKARHVAIERQLFIRNRERGAKHGTKRSERGTEAS